MLTIVFVVLIQDFKAFQRRMLSSNIILHDSLMLIAGMRCFSEAREWLGSGVQHLPQGLSLLPTPQLYLEHLWGISRALKSSV